MGDTPTSPGKDSPLQPFPGFRRSDVLAFGRPSLVRYYALTEQVPLNLNTYQQSYTKRVLIQAQASYITPQPLCRVLPHPRLGQ